MKIQSPYTKAIIEYKKAEIVKVFPTLQGRHCDDFHGKDGYNML